ncbi:hypothetical protein QBC35DRAFT_383523 [Podospora australis]|uniref:Uncharacterized protein n=1 Tax=Podospora australis TaxID=1536484 RepID=A0AAN6WTE6_9PEZI|nr:hypothetical protein QBC35DRAFT_383523 [Podospora australis]
MAATPFDASAAGNSFVFDIYNDGQTLCATTAPAPFLPGGPCNYTDPSLPRCGCRRFWSNPSLTAANPVEICMCSHHACFHEDAAPTQTQQHFPSAINVPGQENQKPRANREPLSPVQEPLSWQMPTSFGASMDFNLLDLQPAGSNRRIESTHTLPIEDTCPAQDSPLPDTLTSSWRDLIDIQPGERFPLHIPGIPPIPSQCLLSQSYHPPPSTVGSSQARYLKPFAGRGLQTLGGISALRAQVDPVDVDGSPTQEHDPITRREREATPRAPSPSQTRRSLPDIDSTTYKKLADQVDSHEQRIDRLETTSFSVAGHEECHDKHDHIDMRVTELESRVEEVEKILNDSGSVIGSRRRLDGTADDATASVVSVSTNATIQVSNRVEVYNQLQQLQAQVSALQASALPSYNKPWELEVVFLPFPLKGIWMEMKDFPAQRRSIGDLEWTQMQNTISRATPDPQSPKFAEWPGQSSESNWLLPRAFVQGRTIDQRLRSRGLIKTVMVRGADARSVQLAIHDAFAEILRASGGARSDYSPNSPLNEFLGLRQAWVPLRKLHKDSRLRFLTPAEMATPALWDFTFLVSSVIMKATGVNRLYITQPEAYLQDHPLGYTALDAGWTWQKLREMSRVYPDSQSTTGDVPEADALEEYWAWDERVDELPSVNTSTISLRHSHLQRLSRRSSTEPSQHFYTASPMMSNGPSFVRAQSPLVQNERKGPWPPNIRTGSVPPGAAPALASPALSRRRISNAHAMSAAPYERRSSPFVPRPSPRLSQQPQQHAVHASGIPAKRRHRTRSPSLIPRNTPRWSRTSMSRSPSLAPPGMFGHQDPRVERGTTPFYYHTPHSEAVPEHYYNRGSSRPPVMLRTNGYEPDDDEEMSDNFHDEEEGFSSDPYDSEMTNDGPDDHTTPQNGRSHHGSKRSRATSVSGNQNSFGFETDNADFDIDIDVYEDDELDGVDTDHTTTSNHHHASSSRWSGFGRQVLSTERSVGPLRPEDVPWTGIEDHMSDGENMDPSTSSSFSSSFQSQPHSQLDHDGDEQLLDNDDCLREEGDDDDDDDKSQAPSEYSSKPGPWQIVPHHQPQTGAGSSSTGTVDGEKKVGNEDGDDDKSTTIKPKIKIKRESLRDFLEDGGFEVYEDGTAGVPAASSSQ